MNQKQKMVNKALRCAEDLNMIAVTLSQENLDIDTLDALHTLIEATSTLTNRINFTKVSDSQYKCTLFGFQWNDVNVNRMCSDEKTRTLILGINTPTNKLQIYITRTGQVRVFKYPKNRHNKNRGEMKCM